jgi:hypothetical protein
MTFARPVVRSCDYACIGPVLLFVLGAGFASPVFAEEWNLLINGQARHLGVPAGQHYNERNWGLGLQYDFIEPEKKWIPFVNASEFKDSNGNLSYYAGGGINRRFIPIEGASSFHIDIGAVGFLMHRKDFKDGRPFPGILPVASVGTDRLSLNITYIPKVEPKMVPLWFFQLKLGMF